MRDGGLKRVKAIVEPQQRVPAKGDHDWHLQHAGLVRTVYPTSSSSTAALSATTQPSFIDRNRRSPPLGPLNAAELKRMVRASDPCPAP
jgi:hypothetical protein